jgi:hypothetical protein
MESKLSFGYSDKDNAGNETYKKKLKLRTRLRVLIQNKDSLMWVELSLPDINTTASNGM